MGIALPSKEVYKLAAPKPVKARPQALSHLGNSKWILTSPIKNEKEEHETITNQPL